MSKKKVEPRRYDHPIQMHKTEKQGNTLNTTLQQRQQETVSNSTRRRKGISSGRVKSFIGFKPSEAVKTTHKVKLYSQEKPRLQSKIPKPLHTVMQTTEPTTGKEQASHGRIEPHSAS